MTGKRQIELTDGQKDCLRLVADHRTSKEIARILGISPFTVDQRLDAARDKLQAPSRKEAARLFAFMDEQGISQPLVYQSEGLVPSEEKEQFDSEPDQEAGQENEKQNLEYHGAGIPKKMFGFLSVPPLGGPRHQLSKKEIAFQSINIAFFGALAVAIIVTILSGAMALFGSG